ncbi:hypothetical protein I5M27_13700 [Adhaeribacter sp. BT258]|uniref:Uncharacterized protein n=1 Tax=Adhaeribacter terrigena TaxID=2793070 RepID=A0ABS1C3S2_9BACT|nr:hypothetical protein [Adhaeribacter terrigena]MBK0404044.1 hypothetical protein [Adhaeribacter terrigena]
MKNLKENEREVIKLINFFRKRAERLIEEGALSEEEQQVTSSCQKLEESLYIHAANRDAVLEKRDQLNTIVKDNAACPKCESNANLKFVTVEKNEQGWKSNRYKCRRCNIAFTWNRPNNPWDLVLFLKVVVADMEAAAQDENETEQARQVAAYNRDMMLENLAKLEPVLQSSDEELAEMEAREREMSKLIHQFKNYLLIEKIKLDTWVEPKSLRD